MQDDDLPGPERTGPLDPVGLPSAREAIPEGPGTAVIALGTPREQARVIVRNVGVREVLTRHATGVAGTVLVLSVAAFAVFVGLSRVQGPTIATSSELLYIAAQVLPYGVVGAVLVGKRPDLPFGWLLSLAALSLTLMLVVVGCATWALEHGRGGALAGWALSFGSLAFVPTALQGVINVRFPSGRPSGRSGRLLDRLLVWGIAAILLGGMVIEPLSRVLRGQPQPTDLSALDDGAADPFGVVVGLATPAVILLGVLAGLGVVARCIRATGVERKQLLWRAAGVLLSLAMFPFAVTETLPDWVGDVDPLLFVVTLLVPVLRYDLWAIDALVRRSAASTLAGSGSVVQNLLQVVAQMLRLPHAAVCRDGRVLASYGEPTGEAETWPLVYRGQPVGTLVAAPRRGLTSLDEQDRRVLSTVAQLIAGSVRAEALTLDLMDARQRLVSTREEERRRLRRDLHDGLGPLLTGLGLNLDAAQAILTTDPNRAATYVGHAKEASSQVITSLRDVVNGLRPAPLDELGLVGALRAQAERIGRDSGLVVQLRAPQELVLPAAVEVAAYRTAVEGMTNAVRHCSAGRVLVALELDVGQELHRFQLAVTVCDDGRDTAAWAPGVGLAGMRERAEELGGTFSAGPSDAGGRVRATFPLGRAAP